MTTVGVVSPGAMGAALGRAWAIGGARVVATVAGRSERTRRLAHGLELLPDLRAVVAASDVVVSVCPPAAAPDVVDAVLAAGSRPAVLADLNAISPRACAELAATCAAAGWDFVDGSISGGPPSPSAGSDTRLYLAGEHAGPLAAISAPGLSARVVGRDVGAASAVKMCTASVYKGTTALWTQALETAAHHDVVDVVLDDLAESSPELAAGAARMVAVAVSKSGRYVAEMEHIAATQEAAGVDGRLFTAIAGVYRRLAATPLAALSPEEAAAVSELRDVLERLGRSGPAAG